MSALYDVGRIFVQQLVEAVTHTHIAVLVDSQASVWPKLP